ncbi:hypothetical protein PP175_25670 (plasmid) [Aneurinibacillus sp. Ricciae_BoGa-3]|uniref:hypothetical protein n=1 Tax=Aneurinibacillus sp. Ricciae_BoGa-3 TaxID=3022697 RepID=UPI002341868A|nr:hypothetical protein [Aneurinibacillus sp. Ricciae_BoGa-3]WCK57458.1 hypothetical protein PP175_25670 [Aneurinibacillus sp. Ricciae_BoGa-3]
MREETFVYTLEKLSPYFDLTLEEINEQFIQTNRIKVVKNEGKNYTDKDGLQCIVKDILDRKAK